MREVYTRNLNAALPMETLSQPGRNATNIEGEMMAPQWFQARVKAGYNYLLVQAAAAPRCEQYREAWGVKLDIFNENGCS